MEVNSQDLDSGEGGEMLETARSLLDFLGFFGWICHGFSKLLYSLRVFLFSVRREKIDTISPLIYKCSLNWKPLFYEAPNVKVNQIKINW